MFSSTLHRVQFWSIFLSFLCWADARLFCPDIASFACPRLLRVLFLLVL
jgi:hypothetical protein